MLLFPGATQCQPPHPPAPAPKTDSCSTVPPEAIQKPRGAVTGSRSAKANSFTTRAGGQIPTPAQGQPLTRASSQLPHFPASHRCADAKARCREKGQAVGLEAWVLGWAPGVGRLCLAQPPTHPWPSLNLSLFFKMEEKSQLIIETFFIFNVK